MFDHVGLKVDDWAKSLEFYRKTLAALGYELVSDGEGYAGFGPPAAPALWLYAHEGPVGQGMHLAFRADSQAAVRQFHAAGIAAHGRDNGKPGLRPDYGPTYYAAFLFDPSGHNLEAVCFS
ncbi:MAG: VOC family protein [Burkholderiaceae bacterium]